MKLGIALSVVWADEHLLEFRVRASNGAFSGQANVYADLGAPGAFADEVRGFPRVGSDERRHHIGARTKEEAGGAVAFRFYCFDSAGHCAVEVRIWTDQGPQRRMDEAMFHIVCEPAAIDSFVDQLCRMSATVGEEARLEGTSG